MTYDLVIRDGQIADGSGAPAFSGDVGIKDGKIAEVGKISSKGREEFNADGRVVTPGFVDIHTHYDGQAIWSDRMAPSSNHGVTTVLMGNCGVGFAPCRKADHALLVDVMEGVEDIPEAVMTAGLPWDWETFPEYLDALDSRKRDIDVAAFLPHSPLRVYVMGERGARREQATADDLAKMKDLAREAIKAGAMGFASSRLIMHRTGKGDDIPSYGVAVAEVEAIAQGLVEAGGGLLQFVPDIPREGYANILNPMFDASVKSGLPLTFTLGLGNTGPGIYPQALALMEQANARGGQITAQVLPRPIGLLIGLELTAHPFALSPTYKAMAHLPLAQRVAEMRKPEVRAKILAEPVDAGHPLTEKARNFRWIFPIGAEPNYEPPAADSIELRAAARGVTPLEEAYDRLLDEDGKALMMLAMGNYMDNSLDTVGGMFSREDVVVGLGDGGAHYGMVCDATYTTSMLTLWTRDRVGMRISLENTIQALTEKPARVAGMHDRGRIAKGYKADINVIDHERLKLLRPQIVRDLPGGGRRLDQRAKGFAATFVNGQAIVLNDEPTAARPGHLVRGRQHAPV